MDASVSTSSTPAPQVRRQFPFSEFEPKWQAYWLENATFRAANPGEPGSEKPTFYALDMFPYPSGAGLHVGHPEGWTATDILCRYRRMRGDNVLHPMGWDSFGLPAEQYAVKTGQHPRVTTENNINNFRRQIQALGFSYDWSREVATTDPAYFRWTQWIFLQLYQSYFDPFLKKARPIDLLEDAISENPQRQAEWMENPFLAGAHLAFREARKQGDAPTEDELRAYLDEHRLAFVSEAPVNWSPDLGTVLANEEVEEWTAKGHTVVRKPMRQWMLRITDYAQRLLDDLDQLDWSDSLKEMQRNWIGRSEGAEVRFEVADADHDIEVFTTRPDTLFGVTYMVLAPEHELVAEITTDDQKLAVEDYVRKAATKSDLDRTDLAKDKTGVFTGAHAVNPVNGEKIPVWIADYVLTGYGTGAIMAVPAHDERDLAFAQEFGLPIVQVVEPDPVAGASSSCGPVQGMREDLPVKESRGASLPHWEQQGATYAVTFRLHDSLPAEKLAQLQAEYLAPFDAPATQTRPLSEKKRAELTQAYQAKLQSYLDAGHGECFLADEPIGLMVLKAIGKFNGKRYNLHAACVMPNHVHVVLTPKNNHKLSEILHSWKSYTSNQANKRLQREGDFWQQESYDHLIRSQKEFDRQVAYVLKNPGSAGITPDKRWTFQGLPQEQDAPATTETAFTGHGTAVHSESGDLSLNGLPTPEAKQKITAWLEENGLGAARVNFKLRDWLFSRQRYWGEPFPIVWKDGHHHALPESELPVLPPEMDDYKPAGDGSPPLSKATDWVNRPDGSRRETNTMPQWAGSCWYYLRYLDPDNETTFCSPEADRYWMQPGGVDLYIGGVEHAVLHLLYARFWHKVLFDLGHVSTAEPFHRLVNQGLILGEDSQKMSKSRGNVVNPDDVVAEYGADALRCFEMFMGPLEQVKPWSMSGVEGVYRFLGRVWRLVMEEQQDGTWTRRATLTDDAPSDAVQRAVHTAIRGVTDKLDGLLFNTALSDLMVLTNALTREKARPRASLETLVLLLAPFAPHLAEELWCQLGHEGTLAYEPWPEADDKWLAVDNVQLIVQVNGKVRGKRQVPAESDKTALEALAREADGVAAWLEGKTVVKTIVVPGKLVNFVVK